MHTELRGWFHFPLEATAHLSAGALLYIRDKNPVLFQLLAEGEGFFSVWCFLSREEVQQVKGSRPSYVLHREFGSTRD
jgi:hypothetical protein